MGQSAREIWAQKGAKGYAGGISRALAPQGRGLFPLFLENAWRSKSLVAEAPAADKVLSLGKAGNKGESLF